MEALALAEILLRIDDCFDALMRSVDDFDATLDRLEEAIQRARNTRRKRSERRSVTKR